LKKNTKIYFYLCVYSQILITFMHISLKKLHFHHTLKNIKKKKVDGYHNKFVIIHYNLVKIQKYHKNQSIFLIFGIFILHNSFGL